jgi:phenylpropionate dioxygenase-like ring-hydroxylating dioxygenase large terminal subunit
MESPTDHKPNMVLLPRNCTFSPEDWQILASAWHPVAFSQEVTDLQPYGTTLLDERLVLWRSQSGEITVAQDLCLHRGVPLSLGWVERDRLVCKYHGICYDRTGQCVQIPAQPDAAIPDRLKLKLYRVREAYGLVWVKLLDSPLDLFGDAAFPKFSEWDNPDYINVLPDSVAMNAAAGRQMEGFLDVSHFAFVHENSFGERDNPEVPDYPVTVTEHGFTADYVSTVSNYAHGSKHLNPPGFLWRRFFQVWLPFTAKLTVFFPHGELHILNVASPVSARKTRLFVPISRNFDPDLPLQTVLDFNAQIFSEDQAIVEQQYPEDLPLRIQDEVHISGDKSSIAYRKGLAALGLGRSFTA